MAQGDVAAGAGAGDEHAHPDDPQAGLGVGSSSTGRWDGLDVQPLRDLARRALFQALDAISQPPPSTDPALGGSTTTPVVASPAPEAAEARSLFLDPSLAGALGLVVDVASLKQHGVERMFWLEEPSSSSSSPTDTSDQGKSRSGRKRVVPTPISAPTRSIVYVCRPETRWMRAIAGEFDLLFLCSARHLVSPDQISSISSASFARLSLQGDRSQSASTDRIFLQHRTLSPSILGMAPGLLFRDRRLTPPRRGRGRLATSRSRLGCARNRS